MRLSCHPHHAGVILRVTSITVEFQSVQSCVYFNNCKGDTRACIPLCMQSKYFVICLPVA